MRGLFKLGRFPKRFSLGAALVLVAVILSGCGAAPLGEGWPGLTTDGKYVYAAFKDLVFRFDATAQTPHIDWAASAPGKTHMYAPPALAPNGAVFVGAYDRNIYSFSPSINPPGTAIASWQAEKSTDKVVGGALVYNNVVYVGQGDKGIKAYDAQTGADKGKFLETKYGVWAAPVVDPSSSTIYVASLDHNLYALDSQTLSVRWQLDLGGTLSASPLIQDGYLYIGTFNNEVLKVNLGPEKALQDRIEARFKTQGWVWATPTLSDGVIYIGDLAGNLYALDAKTLEKKWQATDTEHPGGIRGKAAVAKDKVIVGSDSKYISAYLTKDSADGRKAGDKVWRNLADDKIYSDLIVVGDNVIYGTQIDANIVEANNVDQGNRSWLIARPSDDELSRLASATPAPTATPGSTATDIPR